jgi:hypothetical protein
MLRACFLSLTALVLLLAAKQPAQAGGRCRGTKVPYAGRCIYPSELAAIRQRKASQNAKAAREKAAREKAAREKAAREKAAREKAAREHEKVDKQACAQAKTRNTKTSWQTYVMDHPKGNCQAEAQRFLAALEEQEKLPSAAVPASQKTKTKSPDPRPSRPIDTKAAKPSRSAKPEPSPHASPSSVSPLVWVGFGTAAAFGIAGGVLGGLSFSESKKLQEACSNNLCSSDLESDIDSMKLKGHLATASLALAGAGAAVGVLGLLLNPGSADDPKDKASKMTWQLGIGPGSLRWKLHF